ncbi:Nitrate reductase [Gossypium arboreum]|uniref:Nitrate reductase n=1 Tax=Gossypium arboreum TaxID=29729 RepID=A0A0B0NMR3_GOSAR|nr:Nitrate reductase [Gossypium arboreum]
MALASICNFVQDHSWLLASICDPMSDRAWDMALASICDPIVTKLARGSKDIGARFTLSN